MKKIQLIHNIIFWEIPYNNPRTTFIMILFPYSSNQRKETVIPKFQQTHTCPLTFCTRSLQMCQKDFPLDTPIKSIKSSVQFLSRTNGLSFLAFDILF